MWRIPWQIVERMMIDAPRHKTGKTGEKDKVRPLTAENAQGIADELNAMFDNQT
ncbi:hypothetical protein [Spirosoma validum]|uniref:Uncharacterized protein n=1 Tax=Spirosoma validum TaxID=2771355 RepID=A0A927B1S7_9BACT|nr:hypothetical protein [Spirosoma validum]MBD2753781.1 hypothetical protein [Spirosoma validum]